MIAHFAVAVDDKKLTEMDKSLDRLKKRVANFGMAAAGGLAVAGYGAYKLVTAFSHAEESLNVLQQTFGDATNSVLKWSTVTAEAMGRSRYEMRDMAGRYGAFMSKPLEGSGQNIAKMSEKLSELTVDLASFYDMTDEEAKVRLFSGLTGETEAVRRMGIDISDTSLEQFNKDHGDNRTMRSLGLAEKTMLRYKKILADTVMQQGDAVRTADSWANQLKRLQARAHDLAVDYGRRLMPYAKQLLKLTHKLFDAFEKTVEYIRKHGKSAMEAMALTAAATLASWVLMNKELLKGLGLMVKFAYQSGDMNKKLLEGAKNFGKMALSAAAITAAFLVIQDVMRMINGEESTLGHFMGNLAGVADGFAVWKTGASMIAQHFKNAGHYVWNLIKLLMKIPIMLNQIREGNLEGARATAASITATSLSEGVVDPVAAQAKVDADKKAKFDAAVRAGDIQGAVKNRKEGMTPQDAAIQFTADRKKLFEDAKVPSGSINGIGTQVAPGLQVLEQDVMGGLISPNKFTQGGLSYKGRVEIGELTINVENKGEPVTETVAGGFKKALQGVDVSSLNSSYAGAEQ